MRSRQGLNLGPYDGLPLILIRGNSRLNFIIDKYVLTAELREQNIVKNYALKKEKFVIKNYNKRLNRFNPIIVVNI